MLKANLNKANNQKALDYILYMMASSLFEKTVCMSHIRENQLLINYRMLNPNKAYPLEDRIAKFTDEVLTGFLPEEIQKSSPCVWLRPVNEEKTAVCFKGNGWALTLSADFAGNGKVEIKVGFKTLSQEGEKTEYFVFPNKKAA